MIDNDYFDDADQHICQNCGYTCDCGAKCGDVLPDGYSDYCLSCSSCNDTVREEMTEAMMMQHAVCMVGW